MPSHNHSFRGVNDGASRTGRMGAYPIKIYQDNLDNWSGPSSATEINNTGGNAARDNLQPYIAVYMWRRTS